MILIVSTIRILFFSKQPQNNIRFETLAIPDKQCYSFNPKNHSEYLFNRDTNELKWIFQNPWISDTNKTFLEKYPFSSHSISFYYKTIKVFIQNKFAGYFICSVREGHLKTLYFNLPPGIEKETANFLKQFCTQNKIEIITVYKSEIARQIFPRKFPFLYVKKYGQKIYCSFEINNEKELQFQDGDGDVIFT